MSCVSIVKKRELQKARNIIIYVFRIQWNVDKYTTKNFIKYYEYGEFLNFAKRKDSCLCHVPIEYITAKLYSAAALNFSKTMDYVPNSIWNEEFAMEVATLMGSVSGVPKEFVTREMHRAIALKDYYHIRHIPRDFIDQELCNEVFEGKVNSFLHIPPQFLTQRMYDIAYHNLTCYLHIPNDFISEKIAITAITERGFMYSQLPPSAITPLVRKLAAYLNPWLILKFDSSMRNEKIIEIAIYEKIGILHNCKPFEITEKLAMLSIVFKKIHQKDLPRVFHTTDFVLRMAEKYIFEEDFVIPQYVNEEVLREMSRNVDKKSRKKDLVNNSLSIEFAKYYFAGDNLDSGVLKNAVKTRSGLS